MESCGSTFNQRKNNEEIRELLSHILNKLDRLEQKIERQEFEVKF